jgi:hypothetical protein
MQGAVLVWCGVVCGVWCSVYTVPSWIGRDEGEARNMLHIDRVDGIWRANRNGTTRRGAEEGVRPFVVCSQRSGGQLVHPVLSYEPQDEPPQHSTAQHSMPRKSPPTYCT